MIQSFDEEPEEAGKFVFKRGTSVKSQLETTSFQFSLSGKNDLILAFKDCYF